MSALKATAHRPSVLDLSARSPQPTRRVDTADKSPSSDLMAGAAPQAASFNAALESARGDRAEKREKPEEKKSDDTTTPDPNAASDQPDDAAQSPEKCADTQKAESARRNDDSDKKADAADKAAAAEKTANAPSDGNAEKTLTVPYPIVVAQAASQAVEVPSATAQAVAAAPTSAPSFRKSGDKPVAVQTTQKPVEVTTPEAPQPLKSQKPQAVHSEAPVSNNTPSQQADVNALAKEKTALPAPAKQEVPVQTDAVQSEAAANERTAAIVRAKTVQSAEKRKAEAGTQEVSVKAAALPESIAASVKVSDEGSEAQAIRAFGQELETKPVNPEQNPTAGASLSGMNAQDRSLESAKSTSSAQESPRTDTSETFDQIVMGLKGKLDARSGKAEIRLDPPNLGTVRVSISLENGSLTADFRSDSNVVRDLLKGNMDKLKSVLEGQGVSVDRLKVDAPQSSTDPNASHGQGQQNSFGSPTHDGRSAGQYQQDSRSGQRRGEADNFARVFRQTQEAPIDLVA